METTSYTPVPVKPAEEKHRRINRIYQGIPSITVSRQGRLFAVWYGGGAGEGPENYIMIAISDDKGKTWSGEMYVVDPPQENVRAFDASLFTAPDGSVHCFWSQCFSSGIEDIFDGRNGVWHACCTNPDDAPETLCWTASERICNGVMMNRAVVLSDGEWALPVALWHTRKGIAPVTGAETMIYVSQDNGTTFQYRGGLEIPAEFASYDEHSIYELADGKLGMFIRKTKGGYFESFSSDRGRSWSPAALSPLPGAGSRGFMGRLASGKLLAVVNDHTCIRRNLTAFLSEDDGRSWNKKLLLDMRDMVSYPDAVQDADGFIYIIYDRDRYNGGEILCTRLTEADIEGGRLESEGSFAANYISRLFATHKELQ